MECYILKHKENIQKKKTYKLKEMSLEIMLLGTGPKIMHLKLLFRWQESLQGTAG